MNENAVWDILRFVMGMAGTWFATQGWVTADQWTLISGTLGAIAAALWQFYVKWNTVTVPSSAVDSTKARGVPIKTVNPITGQVS